MKRLTFLFAILLCDFSSPNLLAGDHLDTLLPPPRWFRDHAKELGIDADVRERIEQTYQLKEPKYHQLKYKVERLASQLYTTLAVDDLDEKLINERMKSLLEAETELKLYQTHVRISLLSQATSEQRRAARELAKQSPPLTNKNWRGGIAAKVNKVRALSQQIADAGKSIADIDKRMEEIDKVIAAGNVYGGVEKLNELIRDLQESLVQ